ncbi:BgtE-5550 [Blumeria graminis f. sp. tritici]|uniref:BgtE-5550 n=3 Tax=Blumeria graminis TaxID=34373 RepID=A0A9X9MGI0_BLUGR|nr:BgtE-5550 [Blumeria graminis f. sp. tritici]
MRSPTSLFLLACVLAGVDAQVKVYGLDKAADCDGSVYSEEMILGVINSYCRDLNGQTTIINVNNLYRFEMLVIRGISHYYLPLPFVQTDGTVRRDIPPRHFAVVAGGCEFQHVAKFRNGPPRSLVVTLNDREVCDPIY